MVFTALSRMLIPLARHLEGSCRLRIKMYGFVWSLLQTYSLRKSGHLIQWMVPRLERAVGKHSELMLAICLRKSAEIYSSSSYCPKLIPRVQRQLLDSMHAAFLCLAPLHRLQIPGIFQLSVPAVLEMSVAQSILR